MRRNRLQFKRFGMSAFRGAEAHGIRDERVEFVRNHTHEAVEYIVNGFRHPVQM